MHVIPVTHQRLMNDPELVSLLAAYDWGGVLETLPAIFAAWAPEDAAFPYITVRWEFAAGYHAARRNGTLYVDVWTPGASVVQANTIRDRVVALLAEQAVMGEGFYARYYLNTDGEVPEDTPGVVHWAMQFSVVVWRRDFIERLEG